jgi:hypothetical protein
MSPFVIGNSSSSSRSKADKLPGNTPAPIPAAPAAIIPFLRNMRRLAALVRTVPDCFITFSFVKIEFALKFAVSVSRVAQGFAFGFGR